MEGNYFMHITIWSDFVCPFCYIGETHLQAALKNFDHAEQVTIEYKSYLLMPEATHIQGESYAEAFSRLKGMDHTQVETMLQQVTNMAKEAGLSFDFSTAKMANTNKAHRLFQYAKTKNLGNEFFSRFYRAHFVEGKNFDDKADLISLCTEVGLDINDVKEIYNSEQYLKEVEQDIAESQKVGVQGVPFFVINNQYAFSGAQPVEAFEQVLNEVWLHSKNEK